MADDRNTTAPARDLWSKTLHGVLATQSLAHAGYPFGSVVPYALGSDGQPLFLLSPLSQHTKNIDADPRCSLTLMAEGDGDVQQQARLTALGNVRRIETPPDAPRYFRFFPQGRGYHAELGFHFYRFAAFRAHWNGGFATARWLGADRIVRPNPLDPQTETRIVDHMNDDHSSALRYYLRLADTAAVVEDPSVEMIAIDGDTLTLRHRHRFVRIRLKRPIRSATEAREVLIEMAQSDL